MQERHKNRQQYFNEQALTTRRHVIPFIENSIPANHELSVLEIGCGEGGNLKPFVDMGCKRIVGVDMNTRKIDNANRFFAEHPNRDKLEFICDDIFNRTDLEAFDLIIMRDVLEHIHEQEKFMQMAKQFLKPDGKFFLGFPPWWNPFGGHQQVCKSKFLSKAPFFHLLPVFLYKAILKAFGESEIMIEALLEVKETGISINRFERIIRRTGYQKVIRKFFLVNPNYEVKFGLKPRKVIFPFSHIPFLRDLYITTSYYVLKK
ncbi:MAG: class I SAM-dependent methyltransferase [Bacteroidales bacterium]|jgi:SAM-dependent methyltransferase|nr:class I SAM-dependent methyltransferase [Bacteroidales bacterium]